MFVPSGFKGHSEKDQEEGHRLKLILYQDEVPNDRPEELKDCLLNAPGKLDLFLMLGLEKRKKWLDLTYSSATEVQKAERIVRLFDF